MLFLFFIAAMVPGMIGFSIAAQDGQTGTTKDADYFVVIRDTIMAILGISLSAVQLIRSPRKNSAYAMAWVFSCLAALLGITAIVLYPLANKAYSSLCGFFAQFFAIASLAILVLDGAPVRDKGEGGKNGGEGISQEKKNQ